MPCCIQRDQASCKEQWKALIFHKDLLLYFAIKKAGENGRGFEQGVVKHDALECKQNQL